MESRGRGEYLICSGKRAINCQLDSLLYGFGLFEYSKKERWSFPNKVEELNKIGIISPRILDKINKRRNLLEHDYKNPKIEEVEDALGIATLFIAYTDKFLFNAIRECEPHNDTTGDSFIVELNYKEGEIIFYDSESETDKPEEVIKKKISSDSKDYVEYLRWFISLYDIK